MALKNTRQRIVAFTAGLLFGPAIVFAGLESATYISDLVSSNPLSSDLASTADDHIRLLKSTIKTTFPNINNAVTVTDEQLNAVGASGVTGSANPTGTIGLSAVNGSATTFMRSDGAPALSQSIAPTWTAEHVFSNTSGGSSYSLELAAATPGFLLNQTGGAVNNKYWNFFASGEQLNFRILNDAANADTAWLTVDRTGTTVDRVAFPTDATSIPFMVGPAPSASGPYIASINTATASNAALLTRSPTATVPTQYIHNIATSGDNKFIEFYTEAGSGTLRGSIDYNRAGTAVRYNTSSDERLKKNFKPAPTARDVIDCIQIESFDWRETGKHVDHGVVAQRLNKCAPYAVSKGKTWQVDKSTLIPALIKYVQEQDVRIAKLEGKVARANALSARLATVETQLGLVSFDNQQGAIRDAARRH